jgi:hypothetical protein
MLIAATYRFSFMADAAHGKADSFRGTSGRSARPVRVEVDRRAPGAEAMLAQPPAVLNRLINEPCPHPTTRNVDSPAAERTDRGLPAD